MAPFLACILCRVAAGKPVRHRNNNQYKIDLLPFLTSMTNCFNFNFVQSFIQQQKKKTPCFTVSNSWRIWVPATMTFMPDRSQIKPRVPRKNPPSKGQIILDFCWDQRGDHFLAPWVWCTKKKLVGYDGYGSVVVWLALKNPVLINMVLKSKLHVTIEKICRLKTHAKKLPVSSPVDCYCRFNWWLSNAFRDYGVASWKRHGFMVCRLLLGMPKIQNIQINSQHTSIHTHTH